ncbi:MAG: hypothetical protein ACREBF_00510 [Candidatus Micrarchaeales archaeon]
MSSKRKCRIACESQKLRSFIMLKPSLPANSHAVAKEIAMCRGVREVALTTGEFGFIVGVESEPLVEEIKRKIHTIAHSKKMSVLVKHFSYKNTL